MLYIILSESVHLYKENMVMIIEDLKVGDTATYYYNIWEQQIIVQGHVIEITEDSVIFSNDKSKYLHKIPKKHLISRNKRPDEIEAEKRKKQVKRVIDDSHTKFKHLSGIILLDKETKKELNTPTGEATTSWMEMQRKRKEDSTEKETIVEPKQEKWRDYNGKHRNQTDESRSESR